MLEGMFAGNNLDLKAGPRTEAQIRLAAVAMRSGSMTTLRNFGTIFVRILTTSSDPDVRDLSLLPSFSSGRDKVSSGANPAGRRVKAADNNRRKMS